MTIQQYHDIKNNYPDAILLFRTGNDYMALNQDAEIISKLLNTTIHMNNDGNKNLQTKFIHTDIDVHLPKLIRAGYKVAVCDQSLT